MAEENFDDQQLDPIKRLNRDLKKAAATLSANEARFLVDAYYQMQRDRIRAAHQARTLEEAGEPNQILGWLFDNTETLERNIKSALGTYSKHHPVGKWAESIVGIGPVISAGLLAHIDIQKAPTVGHIWRFAGLDPTVVWGEGKKRPWNGALKRLCWIIGESFTKQQSHEEDTYGQFYVARKAQEETKNANHDFADQAKKSLSTKNWKKDTQTKAAYEQGMLPQARIHLRAQRYAVKLFLSHWHEAAFFNHYGVLPPKPYVIQHMGHAHFIQPPNMHLIAGWAEARAKAGI
jgi:hypothetical protein